MPGALGTIGRTAEGIWQWARRRGGRGAGPLARFLPLEFELVAAVPSLRSPGSSSGRETERAHAAPSAVSRVSPGLPASWPSRAPAWVSLTRSLMVADSEEAAPGRRVRLGVGMVGAGATFGDNAGIPSSGLQILKRYRAGKAQRQPNRLLRPSGGSGPKITLN